MTRRPEAAAPLTDKVLVVDDDPGMRDTLARMLCSDGYQVSEASSVPEAVRRLKAGSYDLIVADLMMQPLDGLDLLVLLQRYHRGCPAIVVTSLINGDTPWARAKALRLGAADFLLKPFSACDLLPRIRRVLSEARLEAVR